MRWRTNLPSVFTMKAPGAGLLLASILLLTGCGAGDGAKAFPGDSGVAHASGSLSATVQAVSVRRKPNDPAWSGEIKFEVTVTNGTANDVYLVDGLTMPYFEASASPSSTLTLRWDVADWRDDIASRPMEFDIPKTRLLAAGTSHTWTVRVPNPVYVTNHDMVFWDESTTPPSQVDPSDVTLTAPITVDAVIGYGTTDFTLPQDRKMRNAFQTWQLRLQSSSTTLTN